MFFFLYRQVSEVAIYKAFKPFGPICEIAGGGSSKFEVTLQRCASVDALKQLKQIEIEGITLNVSWGIDFNENCSRRTVPHAKELETPPDQHAPQNIMNALNDDCFRAILEHKIISIADLLAVGSTCKRLKNIVDDVTRHQLVKTPSLLEKFIENSNLWQIDDFLRIFGEMSVSFNMSSKSRNMYVIMHLIDEYCPNINKLACSVFNCDKAIQFRPLFSRVKELHMTIGTNIVLGEVLASNDHLERLTVQSNDLLLSPVKLSKLTDLKLMFNALEDRECFAEFFTLNPQLHKLHLRGMYYLHDLQFRGRSLNLPHLEDLTLVGLTLEDQSASDRGNVECTLFDQMKNLKRLVIVPMDEVEPLLQAINKNQLSLKHLSVNALDVDTRLISQMKTIETLYIRAGVRDNQMIQLVECLEHLVDLHINSSAWERKSITLDGIQRFSKIANPLIKARFELFPMKVRTIIANRTEFKTTESILLQRNMQVFVRISSTDPCDSLMVVSYFA